MRCHWCFYHFDADADTTHVPGVVAYADTTRVSPAVGADSAEIPSAPATEVTTGLPSQRSASEVAKDELLRRVANRIREELLASSRIPQNIETQVLPSHIRDTSLRDVLQRQMRDCAREKAIEWLTKEVTDASNDLFQDMHPNVQDGLAPVENPLAIKCAMRGLPLLPQVEIPADWRVCTLSNERPHVFLLSGPDEKCAAQQEAACTMFGKLGWEPKLVWGIRSDVTLPHPRSHWAWACAFLPQMKQLIAASNCSEDDVVLLGEDSCWPTTSCTPKQVRDWMDDTRQRGYQGMWIGACGGMKKRRFRFRVDSHGRQEDQACEVNQAPCGSKLFAVTIRQFRLMEQVWGWVPQNWFVDGVNHLLAASGQLMVRKEFLAGSMQHYSMRCLHFCAEHVNVKLNGTLLAEGRVVESGQQLHYVQVD